MHDRSLPAVAATLLLAISGLCVPWSASARPLPVQPPPPPTNAEKEANALFQEALNLIDSHRLDEACPKLEASQRLDPAIGTQFWLAQCYEQQGRTASAQALFLTVVQEAHALANTPCVGAVSACDNDRQRAVEREKLAQKRADDLEPRLVRLTLAVPAELEPLAGLELRCDGHRVDRAQWTLGIPVDPGRHILGASAPHRQSWETSVMVGSKPTSPLQITVPMLALTEPAPPPMPAERPTRPETPARSLWPAVGLGAGAGIALVLGGVFLGLKANQSSQANVLRVQIVEEHKSCVTGAANDDAARCPDLWAKIYAGDTFQNAGVAAFVVAGLAAAATTTYLVWPHASPAPSAPRIQVAPLAGHRVGGILLSGAF